VSETNNTKRKPLHWRGLTSLVVTLAFLMLATTGAVLYIAPQGRVAHWTAWNVLGLDKDQWAAVHMTASLLFVISLGFHVYFNWKSLVRYIMLKRELHLKREMIGATVVVAAVFMGTLFEVPPFRNIIDLNDRIKVYWEDRSTQPPYPHAEDSTLVGLSQRTGISLTLLQERLTGAGIAVSDPAVQSIQDLAHAHGLSPKDLFAKIVDRNTPRSHGVGWGRKTLQSLCESNNLPLEEALGVLQQDGFSATAESTLKTLAEQKGMSPAEIRGLLVQEIK